MNARSGQELVKVRQAVAQGVPVPAEVGWEVQFRGERRHQGLLAANAPAADDEALGPRRPCGGEIAKVWSPTVRVEGAPDRAGKG